MNISRLTISHGFPPGRLLGPNTRAWTEPEVAEWIDIRPTERRPLVGVAKRLKEGTPEERAAIYADSRRRHKAKLAARHGAAA